MTFAFELVCIDVSMLAPPEPMTKILQALSTLGEHQCLQVSHRREPFPLYDKLTATGWCYHCHKHSDENYTIYICHLSRQAALIAMILLL